ncbi:MAG: preprotein translocase subunit SecG [Candidatus Harrisonbacteria bacterium CG10_big_fil_rev_8_21_14_0_10_49_15]|uniref:Protein-export membrane protein SecG n=1 Tax=Candidatus Harrisonbacteria bacterium CG10_big_fil_rev_8_21_14_0_10_49_15 TaxID=1974587 RepID=A0A2H0UNH9_9BACT|nr:MAG: preprotein translocase subunit SecG [Candidatus Harrisonbacteria bacterium CG10_big_fil_rev_8_21_14_0_10_49_15]
MDLISIILILVAVALIVLILLQQRGDSSGFLGAGGGGGGDFYQKRRGFEKIIFNATIVLIIFFAGLAIANLVTTNNQVTIPSPSDEQIIPPLEAIEEENAPTTDTQDTGVDSAIDFSL